MCLALASSSPYQPRFPILASCYECDYCSIWNMDNLKDVGAWQKSGCSRACLDKICVSSPVLVCEIVAV